MKFFHFFKITLTIVLLMVCLEKSHGQSDNTSKYSRFSLNGAIGNQVIGFPFQNQLTDFNIALTDLGLAFRLNKSTKHSLLLGSNFSYFGNKTTGKNRLLGLDLSYRYTHSSGIFSQIGLEMGSVAQSYPRDSYIYDAQQGIYQATEERFSSGYSGIAIRIGYDLRLNSNQAIAFYITHKSLFQAPYFNLIAFNVLPQNVLALGVIYSFKKLKK